MIEFNEQESSAFDRVMEVLKGYPDLAQIRLDNELILSLSGLEFYVDNRKVYCNQKEVSLTPKEYDILCMLAVNRGRVLTYEQIYEKVWGEDAVGNERNSVRCQIRNLREKMYEVSSVLPFAIRCVREVGYCFEIEHT